MTLNLNSAFSIGGDVIFTGRMAVDAAGDTYVTGNFKGRVVFDPGVNKTVLDSGTTPDMFVAKYSPSNALIWVDQFADDESSIAAGGSDLISVEDIALDSAGTAYVVGDLTGASVTFGKGLDANVLTPNGQDGFLVKINADGTIPKGNARKIGGLGSDGAFSVAVDPTGSKVYVGGQFNGPVSFDPLDSAGSTLDSGVTARGFVLGLNSALNYLWVADVPTTTRINGLAADGSNDVFALGDNTVDPSFGGDGTRATLTLYSAVTMRKITDAPFGFGARSVDGVRVVPDGAGGAYVTGGFAGTGVNFNPAPGSTTTLDSTIDASGATTTDTYLARFDRNLALTWARRLGSMGYDNTLSLAVDKAGNAVMAGGINGPASFGTNGAAPVVLHTANDTLIQSDGFVARVDPQGNYVDGQTIGGSGYDIVQGMAVDPGNNIVVSGLFTPPVSFGSSQLATPGAINAYIGKITTGTTTTGGGGTTTTGGGTTTTGGGGTTTTGGGGTTTTGGGGTTVVGPVVVVPVVVAPTVIGVTPTRTKKKGITAINFTFSTDLAPSINAGGFSVKVYGKNKKKGFTNTLALGGVSYDAATHTVTVRLARARKGALQATAGAGSVLSSTGGALASSFSANFKG